MRRVVLVLLAGCPDTTSPKIGRPPPITDGKCVADTYVNDTAMEQSCIYVGYSWSCKYSGPGTDVCRRGGEATGERVVK